MNRSNNVFEKGQFYLKCHNIYYNQQWLIDFLETLQEKDWIKGQSPNGLHWPVHEFRDIPMEGLMRDIAENINLDTVGSSSRNKPWAFISRLGPGGLNIHYDHRRWAALLFPIKGNFAITPQIFATEDLSEIERFYFEDSKLHSNGTPVFFNSRILHNVVHPRELKEYRYVFAINVHSTPNEMFSHILNGTWLKENTKNIGIANE